MDGTLGSFEVLERREPGAAGGGKGRGREWILEMKPRWGGAPPGGGGGERDLVCGYGGGKGTVVLLCVLYHIILYQAGFSPVSISAAGGNGE